MFLKSYTYLFTQILPFFVLCLKMWFYSDGLPKKWCAEMFSSRASEEEALLFIVFFNVCGISTFATDYFNAVSVTPLDTELGRNASKLPCWVSISQFQHTTVYKLEPTRLPSCLYYLYLCPGGCSYLNIKSGFPQFMNFTFIPHFPLSFNYISYL